MQISMFGGSGSSPSNPDYLPDVLGEGDGSGTTLTGNASANVIGTYASVGTVGGTAWSGFYAEFSAPSGATNRYLARISLDGGSTVFVGPFLVMPASTSTRMERFFFPLIVASGTTIHMAVSSSAASSATVKVVLTGLVPQGAINPPGYTTATNITTPGTATTVASATGVALSANNTTWTQIIASTAAQYGAFLVFFGGASNLTNSQGAVVRLAKGAAASEIPIGAGHFWMGTSGQANNTTLLINATVAASQRLSMNIEGASADTAVVGVIGFS
jgi:hypothetical protein